MSDDEQKNSNKAQDADKQAAGSASDGKQNDAVDDQAEKSDDTASAGNNGDTDENNGDGSDDDVIHVAQTPTSPALLTQLEHNRIDSETRALGAGRTGSAIFHVQRLTALALIPLSIWFVVGVIRMTTVTPGQAAEWLSGPVQAVLMALFIVIGLRHAVIGIRIVLEDYVRAEPWFTACVLAAQAIAALIGTASVAALIHLAL